MDTAVILAGGRGLRFLPFGEDIPKPMTLIQGKPILHYVLEIVRSLGINKVFVVVAYKKEKIIDYFSSGYQYGLHIEYVDNPFIDCKPKSGLSDALLLLKEKIHQPFLTMLGDELYVHTRHKEMVGFFKDRIAGAESVIAVCPTPCPEEIRKNYAVKTDQQGLVLDLEEKPTQYWNDLIGCGSYLFKPAVFTYLEQTALSPKTGRKELADTLKLMIQHKKKVFAFDIGGHYLNINYPQDLEKAQELIKLVSDR